MTLYFSGYSQYAWWAVKVNTVYINGGYGGPCSGGVNWTTTLDITVEPGDLITIEFADYVNGIGRLGLGGELLINESLGNIATDLLTLI